jgi:putative Holliday junction resolvase
MRILGIDFGGQRTGLAIWDEEVNLVLPMTVIDDSSAKKVAQTVADTAFFERTDKIVVGHPLALSGDPSGEQVEATDKFIELLRGRTTIPIEVEDERLSSAVAERLSLDSGGRQQKAAVDALAAAAILESYLIRHGLMDPRPE